MLMQFWLHFKDILQNFIFLISAARAILWMYEQLKCLFKKKNVISIIPKPNPDSIEKGLDCEL